MKKKTIISALLLAATVSLFAQSPKRDVRATWLSTVWQLDWPTTTVPAANGSNEAARETARNAQKTTLVNIITKLQTNNFNTVFFQVRGMSDAFYNSQYEPWSQYLSSERGADPGWDPLAFIIEEAHSRGIEVHAWLNPYRYSTSSSSHGNLPTDYAQAHPEWLLTYADGITKILNPGMPEVRQQICSVVSDIISHYDVDGIVFDDYFYVSGTTDEMDNAQYQAYNPNGLSRADWRRSNVNRMVREVQATINSIKPYITFGIGPAGVAASDPSVAAKYGVDPAPAGSDWQYSSIYSDPLAWLQDGSIDYISPQLYWTIGSGTDYSKLSPWWAKIANHFGRHYYSSNTSNYSNAATELPAEVTVNRDADLNGTTGAVFFRTNDLAQTALTALKTNVYQKPALRSAFGWKTAPEQNLATNLALNGQTLTWDYGDATARYTVYAVPNANRYDADAFASSNYLQGISYTKSFALPEGITAATHKIAVAVYDRYGNEYPPRVLGETATTIAAAQLTYPADNVQNLILPAFFTWQPISGASYYLWELSETADFSKPIASREATEAQFNSGLQTNIKENTTYYWRVKTIAANAPVTTSAVWSFSGTKFNITSPADGATNQSMSPTIAWTGIGEGATYTVELSLQSAFNTLAYSTTVQTDYATIPENSLMPSTTYYVRVRATLGNVQAVTERISFTTQDVEIPIPTIISPADGIAMNGTSIEICWQQQYSKGFRAELSTDITFPTRNKKQATVDKDTYCYTFDNLTAGTWYARVLAQISGGFGSPSDIVTIHLSAADIANPASDELAIYYDRERGELRIKNEELGIKNEVRVYDVTGKLILNSQFSILNSQLPSLPSGIYIVRVGNSVMKFIK